MLWDFSVHNMSFPLHHTCCLDQSELVACLRFLVSENHNRKLRSESSFLFPLLPTVQFDVVHQHLDLRHKQHINSCRQHVLNLHVLVSLCSLDSLGSFRLWEFLLPRVPRLLRFPLRHLHESPQLVRCHHQWVRHIDSEFSLDLRAHCSAILVSRLLTVLCKTMISIVHIVGLCRFHFSIQVEIENVVFEVVWIVFVLSMTIHQFLKMNSHSLTKNVVNKNHVSTVMSEVEILSSFARDFCSSAQHFVYTSEPSIQRSEQSVFVISLKLPSSTIKNPFTTGSPIESSISCSFWTKVQRECVDCSSCVHVHFHPFEPLRTTGGTDIQTSK